VLGDGGIGEDSPVCGLGAIFVKGAGFKNAAGTGYNAGEGNTGDTVFSFNDTVLNGVGFWDLIIFGNTNNNNPTSSAIGNANFDNGTTELKVNNGQGCTQFISPKINQNDVRWIRCDCEGEDMDYVNTATVTGLYDVNVGIVGTVTDTDTAGYTLIGG
jgi:hypothetical protein